MPGEAAVHGGWPAPKYCRAWPGWSLASTEYSIDAARSSKGCTLPRHSSFMRAIVASALPTIVMHPLWVWCHVGGTNRNSYCLDCLTSACTLPASLPTLQSSLHKVTSTDTRSSAPAAGVWPWVCSTGPLQYRSKSSVVYPCGFWT